MQGVAFDVPISDPDQLFEQFWVSLKNSIEKRNALPPRAALLMANQHVELLNVDEIGGFGALSSYILTREKNTEYPLGAFIVSFELLDYNSLDGSIVAILFAGKSKKPVARMAHYTIINNKICCEDSGMSNLVDYDFGSPLDLPIQKMGLA